MSREKTFVDDVILWLSDNNIRFDIQKDLPGNYDRIQIRTRASIGLEICLVSIQAWQKSAFNDELAPYACSQEYVRSQGIPSVILWEDVWRTKTNIVKSRLMALLGCSERIPARLTVVKRIDKATTDLFLKTNHLQGNVTSKYRYGLFLPIRYFRVLSADFQYANHEDLLVSVATFSHARIFQKHGSPFRSHELIRVASLINTTVTGGVGKLIKAFINDFEPDDIMTYVDKEWSEGKSFVRLGFEKISLRPPITFCLNRETYERLSAIEGCIGQNLIRVKNGGSIKFVKTINQKTPEI